MAEQIPAYQAGLQKDGAGEVADVSVVGDEAEVSTRLRRFADIVSPSSSLHRSAMPPPRLARSNCWARRRSSRAMPATKPKFPLVGRV